MILSIPCRFGEDFPVSVLFIVSSLGFDFKVASTFTTGLLTVDDDDKVAGSLFLVRITNGIVETSDETVLGGVPL